MADEKQTPAEQQPPQSPARVTWPDDQRPWGSPPRRAGAIDLKPHSPPRLGTSTPTENVLNPVASPSVVGMYDFAWDESPAVRASPRNDAFNHRSLFLRRMRANSDDGSFSSRKRPRDDDAMTDSPPTRTRLDFDVGFDNDATEFAATAATTRAPRDVEPCPHGKLLSVGQRRLTMSKKKNCFPVSSSIDPHIGGRRVPCLA